MEEQWRFLSRWCSTLQRRIHYREIEREGDVWAEHKFRLEVDVPRRHETRTYRQGYAFNEDDEARFKKVIQRFGEGLALLAAVAHVDHGAWKFILREKCRVKMGKPGEEKYEKEIPVQFALNLNLMPNKTTNDDDSQGLDLVVLFDTLHRAEPNSAYAKALKKILKMNENVNIGAVPIPVRVMYSLGDRKTNAVVLQNILKAEKIIFEKAVALETHSGKTPSLWCTFVLQPMTALFDFISDDDKFGKTFKKLIAENLWFSQVDLHPSISDAPDGAKLKRLAQLMTCGFGGLLHERERSKPPYHRLLEAKCDESVLHQLGHLKLVLDMSTGWEVGGVLSALVLNSMTNDLSIRFEDSENMDDHVSRDMWSWLAYGAFSKRARRIKSLTIIGVESLSDASAEVFTSVLASDHPEEVVCGCPRGRFDEKVATLKSGTKIRYQFDEGGQSRKSSLALTLPSDMTGVISFSDDGKK